jgi:peptidoglycan/xylan/chitin deacetylase (PgdA/CDA1 family)
MEASASERCSVHSGNIPIENRRALKSGMIVKSKTFLEGIPNKRQFLAQVLGRAGAIGLLERAAAARGQALVVLTYHRIADPAADGLYDPVISATPDSFRTQIEWLHNRFRVLTLNELEARLQNAGCWTEPAAFVTFDDGYRDNFVLAAPILREFDVPATFFIPTEFPESSRIPWWDHVAYVIKQTNVKQLMLKRSPHGGDPPLLIDLDRVSRHAAIMTVIDAFLADTIADEARFLEQLASQAEVAVSTQTLNRELFMTWDQVKQLADAGPRFSIGSHAHSHRKLAKLDDETQRRELAQSKAILENRLGRPVDALAYPFGWSGAYRASTKMAAKEPGYRQAFSALAGVNRRGTIDPYEIRRLGVGSADSVALLRARSALYSALGRSFL